MAISLVGSKTSTGSGTSSQAISLTDLTGGSDTSPSADDLVVVYHVLGTVTDVDVSISTSGYTEVADLYQNDTQDVNLGVFYKIMGATPDTSVTVSGGAAASSAYTTAIMVFRGVDTTTPMDATATTTTGINSVLADPTAITPVTSGAWIVAGGGGAHDRGVATYSSSDLSGFKTAGSDAGNDSTVGLGYYSSWTSGSFDPAAFTFSASDSTAYSWAVVTLAIRPNALNNYTLTADAGSYTITGQSASLLKGYALQGATGSYTISGQAALFSRTYILGADTGSYTIGGQAANLLKGSKLTASSGSYSITGQPVNMYRVLVLNAETGAYTITGQDAAFSRSYRLAADTGSYTLTGQSASLKKGSLLTASPGAYTITGQSATLLRKYTLTAEAGSYNISGQAADLKVGHVLSAAAGSYSVTGVAASLNKGYRLVAETGPYVITGQDANLIKGAAGAYTLLADTGAYTITGIPASLSYSGEDVSASEIITRRRRRRAV